MPKKKNYSVLVKAFATVVVVGATSEDEAIRFADDMSKGDFQVDEVAIEHEIKGRAELERQKRHADYVSEP